MTLNNKYALSNAITDFHQARNQAFLQEIVGRIKGRSRELLSYEEVRQMLRFEGSSELGLCDIPLDAIVGSVGRYNDFTRDFLPKHDLIEERWARVKTAINTPSGLPPIDVYQVGETYFVRDGNHRVSVARQMGAKYIQAYVTEVHSRVTLTPDIQPDDLIMKAEYVRFLENTRLDELRPDADLSVTVPGKYPMLEEHIAVHRYFMGIEQVREIPPHEAVKHWYDHVYLPVVRSIRERGILHFFPNRTETDLYLWISIHRSELEEELGWQIKPEKIISDLSHQMKSRGSFPIIRFGEKLLNVISSGKLEAGPTPGSWRRETVSIRRDDRLFTDILIPLSGLSESWTALEQALLIAKLENAVPHGLHIVSSRSEMRGETALAVQKRFNSLCKENGLESQLAITSGDIAKKICDRARWADVVVTHLAHPPGPHPLSRLDSGFHELIQRCPRPILAVPDIATKLHSALLAFDGSPKSMEALFVATYIAGKWGSHLTVMTVENQNHSAPETLLRAKGYIEKHGIQADYHVENGPITERILDAAGARGIDLIIMGGYGFSPVIEVVLGSAVDQVLRQSHLPILVCR